MTDPGLAQQIDEIVAAAMEKHRPPEVAPLDPWAEQMVAQEKRLAENDYREYILRRRRIGVVWTAVGCLGTAAVVAVLMHFISGIISRDRTADIEREHERTEQVQACVTLDEPIERQFCLIQLGDHNQEESP